MEQHLASHALGSGENLDIVLVKAPDAPRRQDVQHLLAHKGTEWQTHIAAALDGRTDQLETRFYLGVCGGRAVANVMTTEYLDVGILGHVFTTPDRRRQGICSAVLRAALDDFAARGGAVLLLGTGFESPAYWIYHSFGFRSLRGGFMRWAAPGKEDFEAEWFETALVRPVELAWRHLPLLALLASVPGPERLRSAAWAVEGIGNLEWAGVRFMHDQVSGVPAHAVVLEGANGAVLGCATAYPLRVGPDPTGLPGTQMVVDCFCHPAHRDATAALLDALPDTGGKRLLLVETDQEWKATAAEQAGYSREGTLRGLVRCEDAPRDIVVLGKGSA